MTRATLSILVCLLAAFLASGCESKTPPASDSSSPAVTAPSTNAPSPKDSVPTARPLTEEPDSPASSPAARPAPEQGSGMQNPKPAAPIAPILPVEPRILELPTAALSTWRHFAEQKPTLVLLSNNPFLQPIPDPLAPAALSLAKSGSPEDLRRKGTSQTADPLLLPGMALTAALRSGFFSKIVWVIPSQTEAEKLDIALFRQQLLETGAATPAEAAAFVTDRNKAFFGRIHGTPFLAVHHARLPRLQEPVLLHIDLSFFQPLYKGEIKTPLYPLLAETYSDISQSSRQILAVTISLSNLEGGVSLASRFVGNDLAAFFRNPLLPSQPLPALLELRANALYLENFFQTENIRDLYLQMEQRAPADASVKYALHAVSRQLNQGDQALLYLQEAAQLEPAYALEYLLLADLAEEKQLPEQRLRMLEAARRALPENPFISLQLIDTLLQLEHYPAAAALTEELAALPWSSLYYPQMPELLKELAARAAAGKTPSPENR